MQASRSTQNGTVNILCLSGRELCRANIAAAARTAEEEEACPDGKLKYGSFISGVNSSPGLGRIINTFINAQEAPAPHTAAITPAMARKRLHLYIEAANTAAAAATTYHRPRKLKNSAAAEAGWQRMEAAAASSAESSWQYPDGVKAACMETARGIQHSSMPRSQIVRFDSACIIII